MTKKRNITTVEVRAILAEAGLRPSPQRVAVLTYVASHPIHPTAEEIHSALVFALDRRLLLRCKM